jgi:hypothetical protein
VRVGFRVVLIFFLDIESDPNFSRVLLFTYSRVEDKVSILDVLLIVPLNVLGGPLIDSKYN